MEEEEATEWGLAAGPAPCPSGMRRAPARDGSGAVEEEEGAVGAAQRAHEARRVGKAEDAVGGVGAAGMGGEDAPAEAGPVRRRRGRRRDVGGLGDGEMEMGGGVGRRLREKGEAWNPEHVGREVGADVLGEGEETMTCPACGVGAQAGAGQRYEEGGQDEAGGTEAGRQEGACFAQEEEGEDGGDAGGCGKEDECGGGGEKEHVLAPVDSAGMKVR
jgi:hypothetical protein